VGADLRVPRCGSRYRRCGRRGPARLVLAVPAAPPALGQVAVEAICLHSPIALRAIASSRWQRAMRSNRNGEEHRLYESIARPMASSMRPSIAACARTSPTDTANSTSVANACRRSAVEAAATRLFGFEAKCRKELSPEEPGSRPRPAPVDLGQCGKRADRYLAAGRTRPEALRCALAT
jgi:hypothetical protein